MCFLVPSQYIPVVIFLETVSLLVFQLVNFIIILIDVVMKVLNIL